jgi:uncharacterized PurR-regulated membrane protein YhhQ (DUF165 family)
MSNELLFGIEVLVTLSFVLLANRLGQIWLVALMAVMLVLMNIFVLKQMDLFGMQLTGVNVLYAAIFLASDLLAEHWGRREAYRAVRVGFGASVFLVAMGLIVIQFTPNIEDSSGGGIPPHEALKTLLTPRGASWAPRCSPTRGPASRCVDFHLGAASHGGTPVWLRTSASTMVSQTVDSFLFHPLAFAGLPGFTSTTILNMILFNCILKLMVALIENPYIYLSKTRWLRPHDTPAWIEKNRDAAPVSRA